MMFTKDAVIEYDHAKNKRFYYSFYTITTVLLALIALTSFTDVEIGMLTSLSSYLLTVIKEGTPLGIFYLTGIGGYFVFTFPLEAFYVSSFSTTPWFIAFPVALLGITLSYTANYYTGKYFTGIVRPVIGPKSFYAWKSRLSKYGPLIITAVNIIPMISQSFTTVLGVFNYNKSRTAVYTAIGQIIKFGGLTVLVLAA